MRFPFEEIVEHLVGRPDIDGPEPGLANVVALPNLEGDRIEAVQQCRQTARHAVIDAKFVNHI